MSKPLEALANTCRALGAEIKSPADERILDALLIILEELRRIQGWQAENQKNWTGI